MNTELITTHLTDADFERWEQGILSPAKTEAFLSHTAGCAHCGDAWFAYMSRRQDTLPEPPAYLAEEIMQRVHQPDVVIAQKAHTTSKRMQLAIYSLKVGMALAASIYMIFTIDTEALQVMMNIILNK